MKIKVNKLPKSTVEIEAEIPEDIFESYFDVALKKLGEGLELPGFRKGKAPESVLLSKIPEMSILEEMAELALREYYPKILESEKIDAIGNPSIAITKIARKNPLCIKITTATLPQITLADYKKIASAKNESEKTKGATPEVTDEELENTILDIRKARAPKKHMKEGAEEDLSKAKEELPELNDEFVKNLGPFENVDDFKNKLRENLKIEKENMAREKNRVGIIEEIIEKSSIDLPQILIDAEIDKIIYRMESDITAMGLKFDDYLKQINKSLEDLRKEFASDGEKRAKLALILHEISKIENIFATAEEIEQEANHLLEHYKDADPARARMHAENVITNEKLFQFLESQ